MTNTTKISGFLFAGLLGVNLAALGADRNEVTVYLWGPDIKGSATIVPVTAPIDIGFDELIDKADAALWGGTKGRRLHWVRTALKRELLDWDHSSPTVGNSSVVQPASSSNTLANSMQSEGLKMIFSGSTLRCRSEA